MYCLFIPYHSHRTKMDMDAICGEWSEPDTGSMAQVQSGSERVLSFEIGWGFMDIHPITYWIYGIVAYTCFIRPRYDNWLVVYLPLWKIWLRQLGWWHSQLIWKITNGPNVQTINQDPCILFFRYEYIIFTSNSTYWYCTFRASRKCGSPALRDHSCFGRVWSCDIPDTSREAHGLLGRSFK